MYALILLSVICFLYLLCVYVYVNLAGFVDDPFGDPKVSGDPYCTIFVGHLSHLTTEETLHKVSLSLSQFC